MIQSIINKKACVLLTATINPAGVVYTKRNDALTRENDYKEAMKLWLNKTPYHIIFCENSGYDLSSIKENMDLYSDRCECLSFAGNNFPGGLGKGYGEMLIFKHVLSNSKLFYESEFIVKVTGRYFIRNITDIVDNLRKERNIYISADLKRGLTFADSRIFFSSPSFFSDFLIKKAELVNDAAGIYFEHILANAVLEAIIGGYKWMPLPYRPVVVGYSGTDNIKFTESKLISSSWEVIHKIKNLCILR